MFEPGEVGHRRRQMHRSRRTDRPQWIVRHQVDIVRLGQASDLHRLSQAADIAHVKAGKLRDASFEIGLELPLAGELLANSERHVRHRAQGLVGLGAFTADRLLQKVQRARRHLLAKRRGLGHRQPVVVIDAQHRIGPQLLPQLGQPRSRNADGFTRLEE